MAKQIRDIDYLAISARIRAMENTLLNKSQLEHMLEARSDEEVLRLLQEAGYGIDDISDVENINAAIDEMRRATLEDLYDSAPDKRFIDVFRLKDDYHNIKTVLKADALGISADHLLLEMGRIPSAELKNAILSGDHGGLSLTMSAAVTEAAEVLSSTRDPQLCDCVLDRYAFHDMSELAMASGSSFLSEYVVLQIDVVNLRALVRTLRMHKTADFLHGILLDSSGVDPTSVLNVAANRGNGLTELYAPTLLAKAAEAGSAALNGGLLTEFEKLCDDAVNEYLQGAQLMPFGEAPLLGYLAARETEYINLRILLMGRHAGLPADVIRSRLRVSCV